MQTKMPNDISSKDGLDCFVAPERINKAVKNARKLYLSPIISNGSDVITVHVDGVTLGKINAKCSKIELEIFKILVSGYNQTEAAQQLNISQSNVSRKIIKLKKILYSGK